ncbi:MAG TPA: RNA polymerase sigma factor SigJ [Acidimicrobiales bacterium]|nr:RNA polymerase sigma factor SigJ [Acidimicrobiales bacterium]
MDTDGGRDHFEAARPRLAGLAYRITGSVADAEDVVQDAWLRWAAADPAGIANPAGWLTTVTSRLALDRLRAQRRRREAYVGPWLPDPVATEASPEETAELAESLTVAFLVMMDRLGPAERVAFLLGDVFGEPYPVIADVLDKTEDACRQLVSRARRKVRRDQHPAPSAQSAPASVELLGELMAAVLAGDEDRAVGLLDPDVVLVSDAGPSRRAARYPVVGAKRVHRLLTGGWRLFGFTSRPHPSQFPPARIATVNSVPSMVLDWAGGPVVITADVDAGRIVAIWVRLNPDKTARLGDPLPLA